ncbi:hypothetical protein PN416_04255 [Halorubrum ezzemoulense]|uniref:helix-turn-helix transcriptional regulator n=1 Tax=Halorubrum ezzemoulense TaxID=337243 RepID=UPI00232B2C4F|nr:hypothetical protein [Halorubrum ezzemoulense]MDB9279125.1 hypothetical protein [Halorubrum ezzemoulense]MDB9282647.1 hypothetical protein [Halorubrum ezzemoulense]
MRNPALRAFLVAIVALALLASAGGAVTGATTAPSPLDAEVAPNHAGPLDGSTDVRGSLGGESAVRQQTDDAITSPSTTRIRLALNPDRSADWTVAVRYSLADENETDVFRTAGERFRGGEIGPNAALFEGFRREASRTVDRSMSIEGVEREVEVYEDPSEFDVATEDAVAVGEFRLRFTWTEFLAQDGESLILGDALTTPGNETWLRSLEASQTLEVATPEGYAVTGTPSTAVTQLSDGDVIIEGPQTFESGDPVRIVYDPAGAGAPWGMLAAAILLGATLIAGSVVGYRRITAEEDVSDESAATSETADPGGADRKPIGAGDGGPEDDGSGDDPGDSVGEGEDGDDGPDLSLLSDEERVERLLDENGGRMRQADIVAETGWSDAKVSQLLSAMADEGRVEKLRLGRENLISLPDGEDETGGDGEE